ncbi:hypothetical protein TNCV_3229431 [Trichonephila clavipes]|nr:hypothetical protein TNCV_3229431 [Trichonephila clavipes]
MEKTLIKLSFQMDKASGHTSKSAAVYLAKKESETGIKCIPFDEICVKSSDASPMYFCAFGLLKRGIFRKAVSKKTERLSRGLE